MSSKKTLVPASKSALYRMKYEIAAEFGLPVAHHGAHVGFHTEFASELGSIPEQQGYSHNNWGNLTSRDAGSVGGEITKRLIRQALGEK
ncbi:alpha/beta-type small acid-soluble spore protein [Paenibacillus sp. 481]|uniref:alpha/beta-type small acid-soluble spore protein n=1 Tax=Paenibacillus sp. 481 TaxID=2835869 RepID=UPI001E3234B6|nr:alpha/beta-type small acid-soluble spore protein [Paenibacillus sp. 481]UHA75696.1 alpha/beta-type small acid-soluble spore protein [Paenibacillus sp. 481]